MARHRPPKLLDPTLRTGNPKTDLLAFERDLVQQGHGRIVGVDEAGRGPLAGPVVAAAVVLPIDWITAGLPIEFHGINDSKMLSAAQRQHFFEILTQHAKIEFHVAECNAARIDEINILRATHEAMAEAVSGIHPDPTHILVDGLPVPAFDGRQTALVRGDSRSYSIAAASILAKVTRDQQMRAADLHWPQYGFARHKGYGTAAHLEALARHGPCPIHRTTFQPKKRRQLELL